MGGGGEFLVCLWGPGLNSGLGRGLPCPNLRFSVLPLRSPGLLALPLSLPLLAEEAEAGGGGSGFGVMSRCSVPGGPSRVCTRAWVSEAWFKPPVCVSRGRNSIYLFAFSFSLSRFFGGYPSSHPELYHSKKRDPHGPRHGQMEALSGTSGVCTVVGPELGGKTWVLAKTVVF